MIETQQRSSITTPRWLGRLVGTVLRSPLHGLASRGLLLLTGEGRRTGRVITLPLGYDERPDGLYIVAGAPETKTWWRNLSKDRPVSALVRGRWLRLVPEVLRWSEESAATFESALAHYLVRFGFLAKAFGVVRRETGFDPATLRTAARGIVMVRLTALPGGPA